MEENVSMLQSQIDTLGERIKVSKDLLSKIDNISEVDAGIMKKRISGCIVNFEILNFLLMEKQVIQSKEKEMSTILDTADEEVPTASVGLDGEITINN
jgi:hypothetical protein